MKAVGLQRCGIVRVAGAGKEKWRLARSKNEEIRDPITESLRRAVGRQDGDRYNGERDQTPEDGFELLTTSEHIGKESVASSLRARTGIS